MSQIRYFVVPLGERWTIRRDTRRVGAFADQSLAIAAALELGAVDGARGHTVRIVAQAHDGRWTPCGPAEVVRE